MVELIQQFNDLVSQIDRLSIKPLNIQINYPTDDFPKETSERLEVLSRCDRYLHALNIKDQMLWTTIQEKLKLEEQLEEERELSNEYASEVTNWAQITNNLTQETQQLRDEKDILERRNYELIEILRRNNLYYVINENK